MYVVRRPFRDATGMKPAGSIVEPAGVKRFERHLSDGHIVEVNEHNFDRFAEFFKQKFGVVLPPIKPVDTKETKTDNEVKQPEAPKASEAPKAPEAPKVTKAQVSEVKKVVAATVK